MTQAQVSYTDSCPLVLRSGTQYLVAWNLWGSLQMWEKDWSWSVSLIMDMQLCRLVWQRAGVYEGIENHQTFCVSLVLVSFTLIYRAACPFLVKHSTIITSEESLRDSKLPVTDWVPEDQGTGVSVWNLCLCHSHYSTQLATCATSYMCISIVSHFTVMFARGTCASWSSSFSSISIIRHKLICACAIKQL